MATMTLACHTCWVDATVWDDLVLANEACNSLNKSDHRKKHVLSYALAWKYATCEGNSQKNSLILPWPTKSIGDV